jgi:hypothetical protein
MTRLDARLASSEDLVELDAAKLEIRSTPAIFALF